jgi:hypothetical protein
MFLQSLRNNRYGDEPMLCSSRITIEPFFTQVEGRVLQAPTVCFIIMLSFFGSFHFVLTFGYQALLICFIVPIFFAACSWRRE